MRSSDNPTPFRLLGFELEDFWAWCDEKGLNRKSRDSKKAFFKEALSYKIIKKGNAPICVSEGE